MRAVRNNDFPTLAQHREEARRLLWVIDDCLQDESQPRTLGDLAVIALAHAVVAGLPGDGSE